MSAKVLIVEHEPSLSESIAKNLSVEGYIPMRALQADHALKLMKEGLPDLIILNGELPGKSGFQILKELRREKDTQHIPIIFLSTRSNEEDKIAVLDAGADHSVTKPLSPKELMARIRAILRRQSPLLTDKSIEINGLKIDPLTHRLTCQKEGKTHEIKIGPTEFKLLLLLFLMQFSEHVHSRRHILEKVWDDGKNFVNERTVDIHIKRLRDALSSFDCQAMIETISGSGYRVTRIT
jgi:two-component system phosphate regulon response regulator PhoB